MQKFTLMSQYFSFVCSFLLSGEIWFGGINYSCFAGQLNHFYCNFVQILVLRNSTGTGGRSPEEEIESQSLPELLRLKEIKQEKTLRVHLPPTNLWLSLYHSPFVPRGCGQHMAILILPHHLQSSIGPI